MASSVHYEPESGAGTDGRSCHILLVEDHPVVLNATRALLQAHGYRVTTATSLAEAIERTRDYPDLDLLITDYHLAGSGTGKQVVSAVREMRGPDLKAIVITGDTGSAVHQFDGESGLCWITKPVNPAQLLTLLKHLLARPAP
jgi:CheY-like chemotaxis protein